MKKQNLTKFALSLVCAAVLSACGGSSNDSASNAPSAEQIQAEKQKALTDFLAKAKTTATDNKINLNEEQLAAFAKENYEKKFTDDAALKDALEKYLKAIKDAAQSTKASDVGYKVVVKDDSNLNVDADGNTKSSIQGAFQAMGEQNPQIRLDHIVVAEDRNSANSAIYLEDFDLTTGKDKATVAGTTSVLESKAGSDTATGLTNATAENVAKFGFIQLNSIFTAKTVDEAKTVAASTEARKDHYSEKLQYSSATKRGTRTEDGESGVDSGVVLTFQDKRNNYTENATYNEAGLTDVLSLEVALADADTAVGAATDKLTEVNKAVYLKDGKEASGVTNYRRGATVAEVYGYRTFAKSPDSLNELNDTYAKDHEQANMPLVKLNDFKTGEKQTYAGEQLKHVQYGRVTTALNGLKLEDLRDGRPEAGFTTKIGAYGFYGNTGTEDHYFFRGIDNITEAQLTALKSANAGKKLSYEGHAVAYGLEDKYRPTTSSGLPTAFGTGNFTLFSGNHVEATYDVDAGTVKGTIFNRYINDTTKDYNAKDNGIAQDLVAFNGEVSAKGKIEGTAALTYGDKSEGTFNATFFGEKAGELGGLVASKAGTAADKAWGASFGAVHVAAPAADTSGLGQASDKAKQ